MGVSASDTMQPMVDAAKERVRKAWSAWLHGVLDLRDVPTRGRPGWLQKLLKKHGLTVSYETCRKWLAGLDLPDRANEAVLYAALGIRRDAEADADFAALAAIWPSLQQSHKALIMETAKMAEQAAKAAPEPARTKNRRG